MDIRTWFTEDHVSGARTWTASPLSGLDSSRGRRRQWNTNNPALRTCRRLVFPIVVAGVANAATVLQRGGPQHELSDHVVAGSSQVRERPVPSTFSGAFVDYLASALGIVYVVAVAAMFYPQIYLNHKFKCNRGLSFGYQLYACLGLLCYGLYVWGTRWVQEHYNLPRAVTVFDVVNVSHAIACAFVILAQNFIYRKPASLPSLADAGSPTDSTPVPPPPIKLERKDVVGMGVMLGAVFVAFVLATLGILPWFAVIHDSGETSSILADIRLHLVNFLALVGIIKVIAACLKFHSQIKLNAERRSVVGLAQATFVLDAIASAAALGQNLLLAASAHDVELVTGNLPKMLNGLFRFIGSLIVLHQMRQFSSGTSCGGAYGLVRAQSAASGMKGGEEMLEATEGDQRLRKIELDDPFADFASGIFAPTRHCSFLDADDDEGFDFPVYGGGGGGGQSPGGTSSGSCSPPGGRHLTYLDFDEDIL